MNHMKILQTITTLNKSWGGPSSCTYNLVKGLNELGTSTDVLALKSDDPSDLIGTDKFIKYVDWDIRTPLFISHSYGNFLYRNTKNYDIIHANTIWLWTTHQACKAAKREKKHLIVSPHGMLYPQALKVSAWKKKIISPLFLRKDLESADVIHVTSEAEAGFVRDYGLKNQLALIPNGLILDSDPPKHNHLHDDKIRFGFVGRINRIKNIDLLIEAWHQLGSITDNAELVIVGKDDEKYETELRQYVKLHHLNNVIFTGFMSGDKLWDTIRSFDCLVLPSKSENFGMVVTEALIRCVPVIASKGTPWKDLVTFECGSWCEPTVGDIAQNIAEFLKRSNEERERMGINGFNLVESKYTINKVAANMSHLYGWMLGNESKPDFIID